MITKEQYRTALAGRHGAAAQKKLEQAAVGIAGLGGLGSNIAFFLARLGVGRLVLADFDTVDLTNLNRQQYRLCDLGRPKAEALTRQLKEINPFCTYEPYSIRVTPETLPALFGGCTVLCEAFDQPEQKAMLAETVLGELPDLPLVAGSGMAGFSSANSIQTVRRMKNFYLCGDGTAEVADGVSLAAPRVAVCAAHQATMAMRLILGETQP